MTATVLHGDNMTVLPTIADCSIDAIVTDPPYELGFMGKRWDATGIAYSIDLWRECLRVLKPGGHLLAFGGTRTYHRMACAIEDAGFEIRDSIHWLYGSGFPKSLDVSKAIDKAAGAEREVVTTRKLQGKARTLAGGNYGSQGNNPGERDLFDVTAPATDAAKQWDGWGTALKPAHEPIVVARKPLDGTVAANVLAYGTGALNIDGCRVGVTVETWPISRDPNTGRAMSGGIMAGSATGDPPPGRWPANIVFTHAADCDDACADGCPVTALDAQSGVSKDGVAVQRNKQTVNPSTVTFTTKRGNTDIGYGGSGGASRFFTVTEWDDAPFRYVAKPSKAERNAGLDGLNHHPTVKPLALMRWLVRLVTPPGGTVLDPFTGSGTTLVAAILEGFDAIGIEMTEDYLPIIHGRIAWAEQNRTDYQQQELPL